jgi:hypothetical protein
MLQIHRVEDRMRHYDSWRDLEERAMLEAFLATGSENRDIDHEKSSH